MTKKHAHVNEYITLMRKSINSTYLVSILISTFFLKSCYLVIDKFQKENISKLTTIYTDRNTPFVVQSLPYIRLIKNTDSTLTVLYSIPHENFDSLFVHSNFKGNYLNSIHLDIVKESKSYVDVKYSTLNNDYQWKVIDSQYLGIAPYYLYQFSFRLRYHSNKIHIFSITSKGRMIKVCDFKILK